VFLFYTFFFSAICGDAVVHNGGNMASDGGEMVGDSGNVKVSIVMKDMQGINIFIF